MFESSPSVIVLAGPNGAGKTTAAQSLLAETLRLRTFVNADVIAQGLAGFDPASAALEAGRIMLDRLHALAARRADFAFETTLAGRTYAPWLRSLQGDGYTAHLIFFWLPSADLAVARVAERVRGGGHDVPEPTVRQRYGRGLRNLFDHYLSLVNSWRVYDNSQEGVYRPVAAREGPGEPTVTDAAVWDRMRKEAGHA
jgi:predicted ABC-type ATPase